MKAILSKIFFIFCIFIFFAACVSNEQPNLSEEERALKLELEEELKLEKKHPTKVIWEAKTEKDGEFITVDNYDGASKPDYNGNAPIIDFGKGLDLTGYNYLTIEFSCPNDDYNAIGFMAYSFDPFERVCIIETLGTKETKVLQDSFGVNHGEWPNWNNDQFEVKPNTSNKLSRIVIYAYDPIADSSQDKPGVKVCVKRIIATNKKLRNNPDEDFVIFKATEPEGHKFVTSTEWNGPNSFISLGEANLENYKYVNFEYYSPNSELNLISVDGISGGYKTGVIPENIIQFDAALSKKTKIQQVPFGMFKGYWYKWEDGKNVKMPVSDNLLHGINFNASDMNDDWVKVGDIEIYVKSIIATNKKLENDTTKDKVIFTAEEPENGHVITDNSHDFELPLEENLEGYNYLNIEMYSPNSDYNRVNIIGRNWDVEDNYLADFCGLLTKEPQVYQIPFGKNHDYDDWSTGKRIVKQNVSEYIEKLQFYVHNYYDVNLSDIDIYIKSITATNKKLEIDSTKDRLVFKASEPEGVKIQSATGWDWAWLKTGCQNLEGYKYLNLELYSTNSGNNLVNFSGRFRDGEVASLKAPLTKTPQNIQIPFGKGNGYWNEWSDGKKTSHLYESNILYDFGIWVEDEDGKRKENINIYVKSITATNKSLNDPSKDKVVYKAPEAEGHKITTIDGWKWFPVSKMNLEEYEYLNFEVYSPNSNNYSVCLLPRDHAGDIGIVDALLTKKSQIIQIPFGKDKGTYDNWDSGEKVVTPYASSCLWDLAVWARDVENDWHNVPNVDVYVKSITATNKKLNADTTKDKVVYLAQEPNGHKITTCDGWSFLATGNQILDDYNYLNIELSSPNSKNYVVNLSIRGGDGETGKLEALLTSKSKTIQIPFGKDKGTYDDWSTGEKIVKSYTANQIWNVAIWALDMPGGWKNIPGVDVYIKSITATNKKIANDPTKDMVIFESNESTGYKLTTKDDGWQDLPIGKWNLEGYKYLNIELYNPNNDYYQIEVDAWGNNEKLIDDPNKFMPKGAFVTQHPISEYWDEWYDGYKVTKKVTGNTISNFPMCIHNLINNTNMGGIDFYVKRIVATNKKIEEPKPKEKVVFVAPDSKGYKLTTSKDWQSLNFGEWDLKGYKYLNIELYSPNIGKNKVEFHGWGGGERVAPFEAVPLTNDVQVIQRIFGTNVEYWEEWIDGKNVQRPATSDMLSSLAFSVHNPDNWEFVEGVDLYIKRIWGTNTELKK